MPVALAALASLNGAAFSAEPAEDSRPWAACSVIDPMTGEPTIHPECFFHSLLERYRDLDAYGDRTTVTRVSTREGETPRRTATAIEVAVQNGSLDVQTSARQVRHGLGLRLGLSAIPVLERAGMAYKIWVAPHMSLKFVPEDASVGAPAGAQPDAAPGQAAAPDGHVGAHRPGASGGDPDRAPTGEAHAAAEHRPVGWSGGLGSVHARTLRATVAERVTIAEREMVHLELRSGEDASGASAATFDLYVDPESMLVERIDGEERMPDGQTVHTTVEITPLTASPELSGAAGAGATETGAWQGDEGTVDPDAGRTGSSTASPGRAGAPHAASCTGHACEHAHDCTAPPAPALGAPVSGLGNVG